MTGAGQPAVPGEGTYPGLLGRLVAAVRPEFRHDILVFAPDDPVFGGGAACRVPQCGRPAGIAGFGLCRGHYDRWARAGRPDIGWFATGMAGRGWAGRTPLPSCRVPGCGFAAGQRGLCSRHAKAWNRAGRPGIDPWLAGVAPVTAGPGQETCLAGGCQLWAQPGPASPGLCRAHYLRWHKRGRPDLAGFARGCGQPHASDHQQADLTPLGRQLRLEMQYALQCRSDDKTVKVKPKALRTLIRWLAGSGVASLLDRSEQAWRDDPPPSSAGPVIALLGYAHRTVTTLAEGEGWDSEYPRDTWRLRRLGIESGKATLQFAGIPQPWLKDLAKRWARWRLSTGISPVTCYAGVKAVTRFAGFLAAAGITLPGQAGRDVVERYLAELHRDLAGRQVHREHAGQLNVFLRDVRRHQWDPALPAATMLFPEDYPARPEPLPRFLAEHIMAQVEDPARLARQDNLAYRLITIVLIRCGLRISDATALPSGCVVRDAGGAPYLRYYNRKMKREALVPIDEELPALISGQQDRNQARWPDGTPVLFPRPNANIDGTRPIAASTYRDALYRWLQACDVRDEYGQPARLTPHQWRHIVPA
jgi:integrase